MKCINVGGVDRALRAIIGIGIIGAGVYLNSWWGIVGAIPLVTAIIGFCPTYLPFKASTCKTRE